MRKDRPWLYGPSVYPDGTPRHFSVSSLMTGDPGGSDGGCDRKWWFERRDGKKPEQTDAQTVGDLAHKAIEHYLLTGEKALPDFVMRGSHLIPLPGPGLRVEEDIAAWPKTLPGDLNAAPLRVAGIPVVGFIDLINSRGTNIGGTDVTDTHDPPGTIEVLDWKTTSDVKWIKSPEGVSNTVQMVTYGAWAIEVGRRYGVDLPGVRLSHAVFITVGNKPGTKRTRFIETEEILRRFERVQGVARKLIDVAKATSAGQVAPNLEACGAFRGCPHKSYCDAGMRGALARYVPQGGYLDMGLYEKLGLTPPSNPGITPATPSAVPTTPSATPAVSTANPPPTPGAAGAPAVTGPSANVLAEMAALLAEETKPPPIPVPPGYTEAVATIKAAGHGFPALAGRAAHVHAAATGLPYSGDGYAGSGGLGAHTVDDPNAIITLAGKLAALAAPAPVAPGPPIVPADVPTQTATTPAPTATDAIAARAPADPADAPAPKPPRRKKADPAPAADPAPVPVPAETPVDPGPTTGVRVYIDTVVRGITTTDFFPIVNDIARQLAEKASAVDVRCAPEKSELGFGKWKGGIITSIRYLVTEGKIPAGDYHLHVFGSELAEAAAEALSTCASVFVRGIR